MNRLDGAGQIEPLEKPSSSRRAFGGGRVKAIKVNPVEEVLKQSQKDRVSRTDRSQRKWQTLILKEGTN